MKRTLDLMGRQHGDKTCQPTRGQKVDSHRPVLKREDRKTV